MRRHTRNNDVICWSCLLGQITKQGHVRVVVVLVCSCREAWVTTSNEANRASNANHPTRSPLNLTLAWSITET